MSTKDETPRDRAFPRIIEVPLKDGDRLVEILKGIPREGTIVLVRRIQDQNICKVNAIVKKQDMLTIKLAIKGATFAKVPKPNKWLAFDIETNNPCGEIVLTGFKNRFGHFV
jgi:hypothetical protein